jgi:hypothetical protein
MNEGLIPRLVRHKISSRSKLIEALNAFNLGPHLWSICRSLQARQLSGSGTAW